MQTHLIQVFPKTEDLAWLRWFDAANQLRDERPLEMMRVIEFVNAVEREYQTHASQLSALGRRLYEWLDGPTERWLEQARQDTRELAVHLDVESRAWGETRLRHLPWELVYDGAFLCADAARPFTPVRRVGNGRRAAEIANRPLRVLFMASSPTDIQPVLAFEREEALILDATHKRPLELRVEESGSLEGLSERIADHAAGYFDVFHLTGHAAIQNGAPVFILENKFGTHQTATADDLARAFGGRFPRLVFLSGCRTGQAPFQGVVPSFSERLVAAGAPAVLGWALPVGDAAATLAAAELYEQLGQGKRIDEAVTRARQKLFQAQSPYWHLLRLYADATPLAELVTPLKTPGRDIVRVRRADLEFLDERAKVGRAPVCPRQEFVGRRRLLQRGLRILASAQGDEEYAEGVVLHGAGGLGKSSTAARLCERLPDYLRLVFVGAIDEHGFVRVLNEKPNDAAIIQINQNEQLALKQRLALILAGPLAARPVLFVFDDFEQNLEETADGMRRMSENARQVLDALLAAIHTTNSASRILITSRYTFAVPPSGRLAELSLERLYDAELDKKTRQLDALDQSAPELKTRALALGAGNPRLMEYLNRVLADKDADHAALLNRLERAAEKYREEILLRELLNALSEKGRGVLARAAVYALPVAREGIQAAAGALQIEPHWTRAVALGLVERGGEPETNEPRDAVSELCKPLLVDEVDETETRAAGGRGARYLHQTLRQAGAANDEQLLEVYRLALLGGEREIAVMNGDRLATRWVNAARYHEAERLAELTRELGDDYRVLHTLARAQQVLGKTKEARQNFEQALVQCPENDIQERSDIQGNLAQLVLQFGDVTRALALWNESLQASEQILDVQGKAATLHEMAGVVAQQGDVTRALALWNESLQLKEQIGDVKGKAATLANMAWAAGKQGDTARERELNLQAAHALAAIHAYLDLVTVLGNLGVSDAENALNYLAQAFWLTVRVQVSAEKTLERATALLEKTGAAHPAAPLVATTAFFLAQQRGAEHPEKEKLLRYGMNLIGACAETRGIAEDRFVEWFEGEKLNDPEYRLPALDAALVEWVGDGEWLFERGVFGEGLPTDAENG